MHILCVRSQKFGHTHSLNCWWKKMKNFFLNQLWCSQKIESIFLKKCHFRPMKSALKSNSEILRWVLVLQKYVFWGLQVSCRKNHERLFDLFVLIFIYEFFSHQSRSEIFVIFWKSLKNWFILIPFFVFNRVN